MTTVIPDHIAQTRLGGVIGSPVLFSARGVGINTYCFSVGVIISIYPNPSKDYFEVSLKGGEIETLEILNCMGPVFLSKEVKDSSFLFTDEIAAGVYLLRVISGSQIISSALVREQ